MVEPRENRIPIMMSDAELKAIDDWRFANRVATRADAMRRLVESGLAVEREAASLSHALNEASDRMEKVMDKLMEEAKAFKKPALDGLGRDELFHLGLSYMKATDEAIWKADEIFADLHEVSRRTLNLAIEPIEMPRPSPSLWSKVSEKIRQALRETFDQREE